MTTGRAMRQGAMAAALAALMLALAAPALGAPGRLLDKSGDMGFPSVFVTGGAQTPSKFFVRVRATPNQRVEVRWDISCAKGGKGKFAIGEFTMGGRKTKGIKTTWKRPDECIANALVQFEDGGTVGKIRAELRVRG